MEQRIECHMFWVRFVRATKCGHSCSMLETQRPIDRLINLFRCCFFFSDCDKWLINAAITHGSSSSSDGGSGGGGNIESKQTTSEHF